MSPKHPRTTAEIRWKIEAEAAPLRLSIFDDGIGGAELSQGSRLIGLIDRVEAPGRPHRDLQSCRRRHVTARRQSRSTRPSVRFRLPRRGNSRPAVGRHTPGHCRGPDIRFAGRPSCCTTAGPRGHHQRPLLPERPRRSVRGGNRRRSSPRRNQQCEAAWFRSYAGPPLRGSCATVHRPLTQSRKASPP